MSGAHMTHFPAVLEALRARGAGDVVVFERRHRAGSRTWPPSRPSWACPPSSSPARQRKRSSRGSSVTCGRASKGRRREGSSPASAIGTIIGGACWACAWAMGTASGRRGPRARTPRRSRPRSSACISRVLQDDARGARRRGEPLLREGAGRYAWMSRGRSSSAPSTWARNGRVTKTVPFALDEAEAPPCSSPVCKTSAATWTLAGVDPGAAPVISAAVGLRGSGGPVHNQGRRCAGPRAQGVPGTPRAASGAKSRKAGAPSPSHRPPPPFSVKLLVDQGASMRAQKASLSLLTVAPASRMRHAPPPRDHSGDSSCRAQGCHARILSLPGTPPARLPWTRGMKRSSSRHGAAARHREHGTADAGGAARLLHAHGPRARLP